MVDITGRLPERDFAGTPYVPVYVMLPVSAFKCLKYDFNLNFFLVVNGADFHCVFDDSLVLST